MHQQTTTHEELIGVLNAISIVSKRLAKNLAELEQKPESMPTQCLSCGQCQNLK